MKELDELDFMPFGKHRKLKMQEVPASYLFYLWTNGIRQEIKLNTPQGKVARYIQRNLAHMKREHPDGIWD